MGNKKDWEEIEKWSQNKKFEEKENFGANFSNMDLKKDFKNVDRFVKSLKVMGRTSKIIAIFAILIVIGMVILILDINLSNVHNHTNVSVIESIEGRYNTKVSIISKDIDENENGIYKFKKENNDNIQFTAIKKFGNLTEDYSDNCHKYYFNKWNNDNKSIFVVEDTITNEILNYDTYIVIDTLEELKQAMTIINDFVTFCNKDFFPDWNIYLKKGEYRIYPYSSIGMTPEDATKNAEELFESIINKM